MVRASQRDSTWLWGRGCLSRRVDSRRVGAESSHRSLHCSMRTPAPRAETTCPKPHGWFEKPGLPGQGLFAHPSVLLTDLQPGWSISFVREA